MENLSILKTESLVDFHEQLNGFAEHHHNKGGQEAHNAIKAMWDKEAANCRDGSDLGRARDDGYDTAFKSILEMLRKKFVK